MPASKLLEKIAVLVLSPGGQLTHLNELIRYPAKGGKYYREVVAGGVVAFEDLYDPLDSIGVPHGRSPEFKHIHGVKMQTPSLVPTCGPAPF